MSDYRDPEERIRVEIGPLRPYQKPFLIMLYIVIPIVAVVTISILLFSGESWFKRFKYADQQSDEVTYDTTETATTANELLLQYSERLLEFDKKSRKIFGMRHKWLQDGKRAETPESVYRYVQESQDEKFLKEYFELGTTRAELETTLAELETEVDETVRSIPKDATKERVFQAERLVRKKINSASDQLDLGFEILESLESRFKGSSDE